MILQAAQDCSKAAAKARLAHLDGYKVAHCSRKTRHRCGEEQYNNTINIVLYVLSTEQYCRTPDYGDHGAGHAAAANNVHLYPTLPMA